jgi:KaiC/GvpD/RAD55 family RecA-like ATPase
MVETPPAALAPIFDAMPAELKALPNWLVWRYEQGPNKQLKIPYRPNDPKRRASATDPATWGTYDQAVSAFLFCSWDGIGFAPQGSGIAAVDLDDCVTDGKPSAAAMAMLDSLGAPYVETSPSGRGLRAFGLADPITKAQGNVEGVDVELYTGGQYVTVTGHTMKQGPLVPLRGFAALADQVRGHAAGPAGAAQTLTRAGTLGGVTPATIADLWSAIEALDSSKRAADYHQWVAVGIALKSLEEAGHDDARRMWERVSERGNEARMQEGRKPGTAREIAAKWAELKPDRSTHRTIFAMAAEDGWQNPAGRQVLQVVAIRRVSVGDVWTAPPAAQRHVWGQCTPLENVTLLGAHGGTGKSTFALQLAVHHCVGKPFMGLPIEIGTAVYFSAEDDHKVLRRRLAEVCRACDVDPAELEHKLVLLDATDSPVLYREQRASGADFTSSFDELQRVAGDCGASLVVVDNASDTFDANEIDRGRVREFMRGLVTLARRTQSAVLLLVHVAKTTARSGDGDDEAYSGSTAWHNSARSRLSLTAVEANDGERVLRLAHRKSNLGPLQQPVLMRFASGGTLAPHGEQAYSPMLDRQAQKQAHQRALLGLLRQAEDAGEQVSIAPTSPNNAFKLLQPRSGFPPLLDRRSALGLLSSMRADGLLTTTARRTHNRKTVDW